MNAANLHPSSPTPHSRDWSWKFWPVVPLYPYGQRRTLSREVVADTIWTFEQLQGILYVAVPIRMTVVRLASGGLLVYAPIAPTPECIRMVNDLVDRHGSVKYIILPTVSGIEHKVFVGPFARQFPTAQIYVAPHQWSFPVNLPLSWLGLPGDRTQIMPANSAEVPFADEFDYATLGPIQLGLGPFEEVALLHKATRTLLVTDSVVSIPETPPAIAQLDPFPLLFHARDRVVDAIEDTAENRRKGWQRTVLFAFYFRPSAMQVTDGWRSFTDALQSPNRSKKAYFGWYPFSWKDDWYYSFQALRRNGQLLVAPILQTLILNRDPQTVLAWSDRIARWDFDRLIPCHLDSPISTTPDQFRQAFAFLESTSLLAQQNDLSTAGTLPLNDIQFLKELDKTLSRRGITPPAPRCR